MKNKIERIQKIPDEIPCCAYVRVSTMKDEQESSLLLQESYWLGKLQGLENRKFCGIFADQGISGYKVMQRKEYCKMIELARAGFIKEIYTKSIYRFGRNTTETLQIVDEFRQKGIAIIFELEGINTLTCSNDVILKLKSIFAQQELVNMSKNVQFSARRNFSKGIVPPIRCYGYDIDKSNHFVINEQEAKVVRLIYQLYLKCYGLEMIGKQLDKLKIPTPTGGEYWSKSTIQDILRNEKYIGDALLQKTFAENGKMKPNRGELQQFYVENDHEPIIDKETFYRVQRELVERTKKIELPKEPYDFTGKIICGCCGKKFRHRINKRIVNFGNELWTCSLKDKKGIDACHSTTISDELLKEIVLDAFNEYIDTPFKLHIDGDIAEREKEIASITTRLKRLYLDKLITYAQYETEMMKYQEEREQLLDQIRNFNLLSVYKKPRTKKKEYDIEIISHIEKIVMNGYKVEVHFKNTQIITKEFKYEHRMYRKNY